MKKIFLFLIMLLPVFAFSQKTNATVLAVHDGDSYKVRFDDSLKTTFWIRLWGVDCPEVRSNFVTTNQDYGVETGDSMRVMLKGQKVFVDTLYLDLYSRHVAKIKYKGQDITEYLLKTGKGWYYSSKDMSTKTRKKLQQMQSDAESAKVGLWGLEGDKVKPSDFRRSHKPRK